jgi:homospermidine synthase
MVGCGTVGQTVLPLLIRDLGVRPERIEVVAADGRGREVAAALGVAFVETAITPDNVDAVLSPLLRPGGFLLNLSVEVGSLELVRLAVGHGALYLDTGIEPWPGGYTDPSLSPAERSNQAFRARALALARELGPHSPTAVIC